MLTEDEQKILKEMISLGFWPRGREVPEANPDDLQKQQELTKEIEQLRREIYQFQSEEKLRQELAKQRKERLAESRRKQQETRERRERERQEKAAAWEERKRHEILYLGEGVSGGLSSNNDEDLGKLENYGLPVFSTAEQLAQVMGISIGELRFLAFNRQVTTTTHYVRFKIPKKTGGERLISAPMPRLKKLQHWILQNIIDKAQLTLTHTASHGFKSGCSIVSNAQPHVGAKVVINIDLKDFFPSIKYKEVKRLFRHLGYCEAVAIILGLLCTEAEVEEVELDEKKYYVAMGDRHLPQGSPVSPGISNLICRYLDRHLSDISKYLGFTYTRYADDLTFSSQEEHPKVARLIRAVKDIIIQKEGFEVNEEKTRITRVGSQQEVTGIVVNETLNVDKKKLKKFRATLYQIEKDGLEGKHWGDGHNLLASIEGFANFVAMVNPQKGNELVEKVKGIKAKYSNTLPMIIPEETPSVTHKGIITECYKQGSKLKVRVISEGYHTDWNVQFPRNIRKEGARYLVEGIEEASKGGFYRVTGKIQEITQ